MIEVFALYFIGIVAALFAAAAIRYRLPSFPLHKMECTAYVMYMKVDLHEPIRGFWEHLLFKQRLWVFDQDKQLFFISKRDKRRVSEFNDFYLAERGQCYQVHLKYYALLFGGKGPAKITEAKLINTPPFIWK